MTKQPANGHWGKFNAALKALDDVLAPNSEAHNAGLPKDAFTVWTGIRAMAERATRFYVPEAANVVLPDTANVSDVPMRMPYPCTMVLSEDCTKMPDGTKKPIWKLTLALQYFDAPAEPLTEEGDLLLWSATCFDGLWAWMPNTTFAGIRSVPSDIAGNKLDRPVYSLRTHNSPELDVYLNRMGYSAQQRLEDMQCDMTTLKTLCSLLEVHDVETPVVSAPAKLQAKRAKNGKKPLYDYHVLRIGGETWDTPYVSNGTGEGRRSHLRRGHIRRLESKTVWVRATYVHGRKDGFLHKDYEVIPPKRAPAHAA